MSNHSIKTLNDEQLVKLLQQGYMKSMEEIYGRYYLLVLGKCLSFSKNTEQARDLAQDVMLKVIDKIKSFRGESRFSTWLYSITFNHCTDHIRKSKFFSPLEFNYHLLEYVEEDLDEELMFMFKENVAKEALNTVSEKDQQMLIMKYQFNKSIKELQEMYDLSASAVKMRLLRAKEKAVMAYCSLLQDAA